MELQVHKENFQTPEEIVTQAKNEYGVEEFIVLFSGGKDSLVTLHWATIHGYTKKAFYCDTGIKTRENFKFVLETCNKFGVELKVGMSPPRFSYEELWRRYGPPHTGIHGGTMAWLKWFPIRQYANELAEQGKKVAFLSGRRKFESNRRGKLKDMKKPIDQVEKNILTVAPLFYQKDRFVWNYIRKNKLDICPVYKTLHISGDCLCGCFAELGEAQLIRIFHPDLAAQIEVLEKKYGGKWGNNASMSSTAGQTLLDQFAEQNVKMWSEMDRNLTPDQMQRIQEITCADCFIDNQLQRKASEIN